jgi:hypothetical protein
MSFRRALAVIAGAAALACNNSPTHPEGCSGQVTLDVITSGAPLVKPRFTWSPRCGITGLTVVRGGAENDPIVLWSITASEAAQIGPAVTYGVTPSGATTLQSPGPLASGTPYIVTIISTVGGDGVTARAQKGFTY